MKRNQELPQFMHEVICVRSVAHIGKIFISIKHTPVNNIYFLISNSRQPSQRSVHSIVVRAFISELGTCA